MYIRKLWNGTGIYGTRSICTDMYRRTRGNAVTLNRCVLTEDTHAWHVVSWSEIADEW